MKYLPTFLLILAVSLFSSCGGSDTHHTSSSDTDTSTIALSTLTVTNSNPANGNGLIHVTAITSNVNPSGGEQVIHVTGTSGSEDKIHHEFDIHYIIYFVGSETRGRITNITHYWASSLDHTIDGGISVCDVGCGGTMISPPLKTLVFTNQLLDKTLDVSTLVGTVVYP